jgi:hypothetical protein
MRELTWAQVVARRLTRHHLAGPASGPAGAASAMCGVHAQVMSAAELSLGLRTQATQTDVREALWGNHSLVKTYGPRGTVHLLPADELALWSSGLAAAPRKQGGLPPQLRMDPGQIDAVPGAIASALDDAELTIAELDVEVARRAGEWAGERVMPAFNGYWPKWRLVIADAAYRGALCFGPNRGRNVTYTNPRRLVPGFAPIDGKQALNEIVLRYLRSYGPATSDHFAQWLSLAKRETSLLFESLAGRIEQVTVDQRTMWQVTGDEAPSTLAGGLRMLPYFDAYSVGCHPRELVFPGQATTRALSRGQAGTVAVVLIDGVVRGIWHQRRSGKKVDITVEPFAELTAKQRRELDGQADRIGEVLESRISLTLGEVTARSHL